jgi:hypothetical protein
MKTYGDAPSRNPVDRYRRYRRRHPPASGLAVDRAGKRRERARGRREVADQTNEDNS